MLYLHRQCLRSIIRQKGWYNIAVVDGLELAPDGASGREGLDMIAEEDLAVQPYLLSADKFYKKGIAQANMQYCQEAIF